MGIALAPNVHLANVDGDLVLLDAAHDDYLCIGRGEPSKATPAAHLVAELAPALTEALLREGLFVASDRLVRLEPIARTATTDLLPFVPTRPRPQDLAYLVFATLRALHWLRSFSPAEWFEQLRAHPLAGKADAAATHLAARRFRQLRPLLPRSGRCLIQSMLLLHFLRAQKLRATWVFGVRTFPFEAHCWLECEGTVLDDTAEHVGWFTPIVRIP